MHTHALSDSNMWTHAPANSHVHTHVLTNSLKYPFTHTSAPVYIHQLTTTPSAPTNSPQLREHNAPAALELQNCRQLLQRSELGQGQA